MSSDRRRHSSVKEITNACKQLISAEKLEQLRSRPEKPPTERFKENYAVADELKKQIAELSRIRKSETVDSRIDKVDAAMITLRSQSKPLKKFLNPALYSTDTQLLNLVLNTTRETLFELVSATAIDPVEAGKKIRAVLEQASSSIEHYKPDKSEWCSEWIVDENMDEIDELYCELYNDFNTSNNERFGYPLGLFHRYNREFHMFSNRVLRDSTIAEEDYIAPSVYPFNVDSDFMLQLVNVERVEKEKKIREKCERGSKNKEKAELVTVNDKASNVQCEEVSISKELEHVLKVLKKELKSRKSETICYYEFVTNPTSYSRTIENMFYVSYLMRDRKVFLIEDNNFMMLYRPSENEAMNEATHDKRCHGLTPLSFLEWKRLSKAFKQTIIEPLEA